MKILIKKYKYILITLLLIFFILNIDIVLVSTKEASILFFEKIFISIFPFIILSNILIYYDYHIFLKNTIGKYLSKLFNIDPNSTIVFILSLLTSQPSNSIYLKDMLDNNEIDISSANKIIKYTYFPSISFVIGTIGITIYKSFKIGLILYANCLFYNILIGLFIRKDKYFIIDKFKKNNVKKDLITTIKESIIKAINTSYSILGNLIIFTIIINLFNKYFSFNQIIMTTICGILEQTNGIINISTLNISLNLKLILTSFILNFSSLSIICQSISILNEYKIDTKKILIIKLIFSLLSLIPLYIFLLITPM